MRSFARLSRLGDRVSKFVEEAAFLESRCLDFSWESLLFSLFLLTSIFSPSRMEESGPPCGLDVGSFGGAGEEDVGV